MAKLWINLLLVATFTTVYVLLGTEGCLCMPSHPQETLCQENSFAALVRVQSQNIVRVKNNQRGRRSPDAAKHMTITRSNLINSNEIEDDEVIVPTAPTREVIIDDAKKTEGDFKRYRIKVHKIFKGFKLGSDKDKSYIYSAIHEAMCGKKLTSRKTYLIIGLVTNGRLTVSLCDHVIDWKTLPKSQRRNIKKNMKSATTGCEHGCRVTSCPWGTCEPETRKECAWTSELEQKFASRYHKANFMCVANKRGDCSWNVGAMKKQTKRKRRRRHNHRGNRHHPLP